MTDTNIDPLDAAAKAASSTSTESADPKPKAKGADADLSSLEDLKGKTLTDEDFTMLTERVAKIANSTADSRVTAAQRKWAQDIEKRMESGEIIDAETLERKLAERDAAIERKAAARQQLVETLAEFGIPAKKGDKKYKAFTEAYTKGIEQGQWTPAILTSPAGVRSIILASDLAPTDKDKDTKPGDRPRPPRESAIQPNFDENGKMIKPEEVKLTPEEARQEKMRLALENS